jgi:hypothetical protein
MKRVCFEAALEQTAGARILVIFVLLHSVGLLLLPFLVVVEGFVCR